MLSQTAVAQEPVPLSLKDCMDYATKHNYAIKNSKLDVLIQEAQVKQQLSAAYPHINGHVEVDDNINPQQSYLNFKSFGYPHDSLIKVAFAQPYAAVASVSASQTLFDGSVLVALQARKTVIEFAKQQGYVTEEGVRYNVFKAYNSLAIAYRQFDIIKASLKYSRQIEHDILVTQQNGFAEKIDVERTSVQVNNLTTDSIRIANMLTVSEQVLKFQMGMDIATPIVLTDTNVEARKDEVAALLSEEKDYNRVPEFNLYNTQLSLNEYNVKRYQYSAIPSLSLLAGMGDNYSTTRYADLYTWPRYLFYSMVGVQLNVPIFNGFLRTNQLREAKLNVEKSKNNIENIKLTIDFQTAQSRTSLRNAALQAQSQHRNVDLANDVLDLAQKKYKAGVGSNMEVTQAQTDLLNAENNYFNSLLDIINAEADLKKALGLLK
jgi:outer membrane protein TolC